MPNREELIRALAELDPAALEEVVTAAYRQRDDFHADDQVVPDRHATAEQFAHWLA